MHQLWVNIIIDAAPEIIHIYRYSWRLEIFLFSPKDSHFSSWSVRPSKGLSTHTLQQRGEFGLIWGCLLILRDPFWSRSPGSNLGLIANVCIVFTQKGFYFLFLFSNAKPRKKYFIRMHAVWNMCQRLRSNNEMHILWLNLAQHSNLNEKSIDMNCNTLALYDMWLPYICVVRKNLEIYQAHSKKLWNSGALQGGINFLGQTFSSIYSILLEILKCLIAHIKVHKFSFLKWYNNLLQR